LITSQSKDKPKKKPSEQIISGRDRRKGRNRRVQGKNIDRPKGGGGEHKPSTGKRNRCSIQRERRVPEGREAVH